ncbi:hypothetical protein LZK98_01515 [Sphingomonas cannabina]|uniref:hypothetical protein n=1 Tax=Sphingomonas cannabina TaxID=2899123 RepID=UPI001F22B255|nr:hypothetical protein [Sphingomonas cannabina]UIJ45669.1 hypothetical protein LZK98_01515 [Sphingomonas cannabina]
MIDRSRTGAALAAALLLAGCGGSGEGEPANQPAANAAADAVNAAAAANDTAANLTNAAAVATGADPGPLAAYVGRHPSEKVDGRTFLDEPLVKAAVGAVAKDAEARDFVFKYDGPDAPIVMSEGRVLAWGCEKHNCGYHNWSVAITPDGASAEVCYYENEDSVEGRSTWYLPGGKTETRPGNCPSE